MPWSLSAITIVLFSQKLSGAHCDGPSVAQLSSICRVDIDCIASGIER